MSKWKLTLMAAALIAQLLVPIKHILHYQNTLKKGTLYKFHVNSDRLKKITLENYIQLDYTFDYPSDKMIDPLSRYGVLAVDNQGFAKLAEIKMTQPSSQKDYVLISMKHNTPHIDFNRYYLENWMSPQTVTAYLSHLRDPDVMVHAELRVHKGRAVVENIVVDGASLIDAISQ